MVIVALLEFSRQIYWYHSFIYLTTIVSSSISWLRDLLNWYIPWPAKKLLHKIITVVCLPIRPKTQQLTEPISQSCKNELEKTYGIVLWLFECCVCKEIKLYFRQLGIIANYQRSFVNLSIFRPLTFISFGMMIKEVLVLWGLLLTYSG